MNDAEAAQQLQTIRTLMERAALYRRALGPILINVGVLGIVGMLIGQRIPLGTSQGFLALWLSIAVVAVLSAVLVIRRQAFRAKEAFWTPPMRRVVAAMFPPFLAAVIVTVSLTGQPTAAGATAHALPTAWLVCYGLALHSAGFFTLRGVRQLGWAFLLTGAVMGIGMAIFRSHQPSFTFSDANVIMGLTFGFGHAAAGAWLTARERKSAP